MTYNVFGGTLNFAQSVNRHSVFFFFATSELTHKLTMELHETIYFIAFCL